MILTHDLAGSSNCFQQPTICFGLDRVASTCIERAQSIQMLSNKMGCATSSSRQKNW